MRTGLDTKHRRAPSSPIGWPVQIEGRSYVCPYMKNLDDPEGRHALTTAYPPEGQTAGVFRCLCGSERYHDELRCIG